MKQAYNISSINAQDLDNPSNVFDDLIAHHSPFARYLLNWVSKPADRDEWCVQLAHDLELTDGSIVEYCFPNKGCWVSLSDETLPVIYNRNVTRVRISKRQPLMNKPWEDRGVLGALEKPDYTDE
jgi:hypothetical protein